MRKTSPTCLFMEAKSASQRRAADSTRVSSTVCRSKVERLMTLSTSAVAVCCWSDSRSSLRRRTFSMAMTAWFAKFETKNSDCADELLLLEHRNGKNGAHAKFPSYGAQPATIFVSWLRLQIGDL